MKSWKTTLNGVLLILIAVATAAKALVDGDPSTNPDYATVMAAILGGIGLIAARDNKVTSEQAGAR